MSAINAVTAMALRLLLLLPLLSLCARSDGCVIDFMSLPQSVRVSDGESISFSCVIANRTISTWYIDDKPVSQRMKNNTYVLWKGCTRENKYCGGTLFIKHASEQMNMSTVSCLVLHETCNGRNVTQSPSATIIVETSDTGVGEAVQASAHLTLSSAVAATPFPSVTIKHATKPSKFIEDTLKTEEVSMEVTEVLVQRIPLIAGAAAVCFVIGTMFGAVCAVTITRGVMRRRKSKCKKRRPSPPAQVEADPTYTELTLPPAANAERERRDNDYTELGVPTSPQPLSSSTPNGSRVSSSCSGAASCGEVTCRGSHTAQALTCETELLPLPPRQSQQRSQCSSCIEVDLDELERAVLQQD